MVFLADLPIFHCAGPTRVCVEGHGSTEAFGVADVAESSRQVTPDDSSQTRSPGWCPSACGIFLQDGWVSVCVFRGGGGGGVAVTGQSSSVCLSFPGLWQRTLSPESQEIQQASPFCLQSRL